MRAYVLHGSDGPPSLSLETLPDPTPGPGEVIIDVVATALNRADVLQTHGMYPPPPGTPEPQSAIPGLECSGILRELGPGVTPEDVHGLAVGDPCVALLAAGGYADTVCAPAATVLPVPEGMGLADAASLPEVACTVWSNLRLEAGLAAGETLLVHGGTGGVGSHAVQVGRALGATVIATAGTEDKCALARDLGASVAINYRTSDFLEELRAHAPDGGADVILDIMGAKYLGRNVKALRPDGRLVIIGMQGGVTGELKLTDLLSRRGRIIATGLRTRPLTGPTGKAAVCAGVIDEVWPLLESGDVHPLIGRRVVFGELPGALADLASGEGHGKTVVTLRQPSRASAVPS